MQMEPNKRTTGVVVNGEMRTKIIPENTDRKK